MGYGLARLRIAICIQSEYSAGLVGHIRFAAAQHTGDQFGKSTVRPHTVFDQHVDLFHDLRKCGYIRVVFGFCDGGLRYSHAVPAILGVRWRAGFPRDSNRRLIPQVTDFKIEITRLQNPRGKLMSSNGLYASSATNRI